ncbi:MAG: histidine kinase [Flavobacteriales bacterium]
MNFFKRVKVGFSGIAMVMSVFAFMTGVRAQNPDDISFEINEVLQHATSYMNNSNYDSAQYVLSAAFSQTDYALNEKDLYFLHCYEAEVMYYNALFEQGLNSALRGVEIAKQLNENALLGNGENLIGLFLMNLNRDEEALPHFRVAIDLISPYHTNDWLAFRYHALANMGECLLKMEEPDSAIYYSTSSIEESERRGRMRGAALARWNIAEALILKQKIPQAKQEANTGLRLVLGSPHHDVIQSLCGTLMKVSSALGDADSVYYWMNIGLSENSHPLNTDLSRIQFLKLCIEQCIRQQNVERGSDLLKQLNQLEQQVSGKQQTQRINILKDYYAKNQKLMLADELNASQQKELSLRKTISIVFGILAVLLIVIILIAFQIFRQRQRIAVLKHKDELQSIQKENELNALKARMETVAGERNRIASDLHDDVGASLSSINIYSKVAMLKMENAPAMVPEMLSLISQNASNMMDSLSDIVWSINPKNDSLVSLMNRIKSQGLEVLQPLDIELHFVNETERDIQMSMTARKNLYLISKEAMNNIAKHSRARRVTISVSVRNAKLKMEFKDDGIGLVNSSSSKGNGLVNMQQRAKEMDGEISFVTTRPSGTTVSMEFHIARISDSAINPEFGLQH